MLFKLQLKFFGLINLSILFVACAAMIIYDPLHIYHKSWFTDENRLHGNMRIQAAGIINNYEFNSVIVGTSMMKGTSSIHASQLLGSDFVNLSMDGSSTIERKYIINYALKKKNIEHVILTFDTGLDQNLKISRRFPIENYDFLYDSFMINDLKAYWNDKFILCLFSWSLNDQCFGEARELKRPLTWFGEVYKINAEISGIENWVKQKKGRGKAVASRIRKHLEHSIKTERKYLKKLELTKKIIEDSLYSLIKENPNSKFHVVFPPYSRFLYALWKSKNPYKYKLYIETLRYMVLEGAKYENLKIYSFDNMAYLNDLNNYRDMRHYNTDMNEQIIMSIQQNKRVVDVVNIDDFIVEIDEMNNAYDLSRELNYLLSIYE
jgi:hypothetical protein